MEAPPLQPPCPKFPPEYPEFYRKRHEMAKVQMLEREIGFLEEELKSVEGHQPPSRCCKEITNFVVKKPDPLIPVKQKKRRSCLFSRWLCGSSCFNISCICCCCSEECCLSCPRCSCVNCQLPKCHCGSFPCLCCCKNISCSRNCCILRLPPCPNCCCCRCKCSSPKVVFLL